MSKYIKHEVVEMDENMIQRCVVCGCIISDYRNCAWPSDQSPPSGFVAGSVYVSGGITTLSEPDDFESCKPTTK